MSYSSDKISVVLTNKLYIQMFLEGWGLHGVVVIMEWYYGSPCGRPEKVCLLILPWLALRRPGFSSEKNCCYSFLSSSKKNLSDSTFRTGWLSSFRKLHSMLHTHKDTHPHNKKGVYKIPCECGKVYIGESGRDMDTRLKEHKTSFKTQTNGKSRPSSSMHNNTSIASCGTTINSSPPSTTGIHAELGKP